MAGHRHQQGDLGGDTEDIISSCITPVARTEEPLVVENNHFEGTNWSERVQIEGSPWGDGGGGVLD